MSASVSSASSAVRLLLNGKHAEDAGKHRNRNLATRYDSATRDQEVISQGFASIQLLPIPTSTTRGTANA